MYIIIWLLIIILLLMVDLLTADVIACFYAVGAFIALIFNIFKYKFIWQFIIFVIVGSVLLFFFREKLKNYLIEKKIIYSKDKLIGQEAVVMKKIEKEVAGTVLIRNKKWDAVSEEDIPKDSKVIIVDVLNDKLLVEHK